MPISRIPSHRRDHGYSLAEVLTTTCLLGVLFAITIGGFRAWALSSDHQGAAAGLQTVLRQTQTRAITEGISFCVTFDTTASTYTVNRYACDTSVQKVNGPFRMNDARVEVTEARFRQGDGSYEPKVTFRPTGTATPGQVTLTRAGSAKTYTVVVEGFTGRVSTS